MSLYTRPMDKGAATEFSLTRFLTPYLADSDGWVLFAVLLERVDLRRLGGVLEDRAPAHLPGDVLALVVTGAATEFSLTRFLTPYLADSDGWVLFVDCDFLFTTDIARLPRPCPSGGCTGRARAGCPA
jgi:hypothetical protein